MNQLGYVKISHEPSIQLNKVLQRENSVEAGGSYLCLGIISGDAIVLADSENDFITLPYRKEDFQEV